MNVMHTWANDFGDSLSRRMILKVSLVGITGSGGLIRAFAKNDFWNEKDAGQWTDSERDRLLTNSPWAKKVTPSMGAIGDGGGPGFGGPPGGGGFPNGGGPGGGGPGGGGPGGGGMGRGGPMPGAGGDIGEPGGGAPNFQMTVRWESAAPLRMLSKESVPNDPEAYRISLSGLPGPGRGRSPEQQPRESGAPCGFAGRGGGPEAMARTAQLEVKGQPPLHAARVEQLEGDQMLLLFHFERAALPITASTKEVVFSLRMGPMDLKVKFSPKEMTYKGQLSL
jgi:hypothetical protein